MLQSLFRRAAALALAVTFAVTPAALAQSAVLDAPAAPLEDVAPIRGLPSDGASVAKAEPKAYAVDYVIAFRNVLAIAVIVLVVAHVQGASGKRKKSASAKSYTFLIVISMVGLLAMQGMSFWLYAKESGQPGGVMHKTVPFGRTYFLY